ncbi:MAG: PAS domain S-box protein [Gemmatimonadota bacterium]|nr:MAG: PAS domain S-box protein [Gemmatimonadota bacterium]
MANDPSILDGLPDPVLFVDRRGCLAYCNRACESAFQLRLTAVRGRPLSEIQGLQVDEGLLGVLAPSQGNSRPVSLASVRIGGSFWDVRVAPGAEGVTVVYCIPVAGQPASWPELLADSADAIWALDDEERIIAWNRGAEEMFGYKSAEIIGEAYTKLVPADLLERREPERLRAALRELGAVRDYQTRRLRSDGREVEVSLTRTLARNSKRNGDSLASLTIVRDLSLRRQIERQVIESEKMVTLGQLAASVAQEIGAPLTTIGLVLEKLRKPGLDDDESDRQLQMAAQQLSRIARLTHGLVELAKPGELHLSRVQPCDIIDRVLELLGPSLKRSQIEWRLECDTPVPDVLADAGQLQQVFLNLLLNAQRALEGRDDGRITIKAAAVRGFPAIGRPMGRSIRIELSDNGPGIDPADLHYIFAPFFSRSGGSGLGLALTKQIIHAHGGTIEARSTLGQGATFTILLPVETDV